MIINLSSQQKNRGRTFPPKITKITHVDVTFRTATALFIYILCTALLHINLPPLLFFGTRRVGTNRTRARRASACAFNPTLSEPRRGWGCVGVYKGGSFVSVCVLFRSPEFGEDSSGVACPISVKYQFLVLFPGGILGFDFRRSRYFQFVT